MTIISALTGAARLLLSAGVLVVAWEIRHPILLAGRPWVGWVVGGIALGLVALAGSRFIRCRNWRARAFEGSVLALALAALVTTVVLETRPARLRAEVLGADPAALAAVGRHLMVTLPKDGDIETLVERVGISGIFLTRRVTGSDTAEEVGARVAALQARRARAGLPPLHVAADQEGGIVAGMTPPLARPPRLTEILDDVGIDAAAAATAADVKRVGITQNFAPVVDLLHGTVVEGDRWSFLGRRAIASDLAGTVRVAARWCAGLMKADVGCTLKHYPGLGRATGDTHLVAAHLPAIAEDDLAPFFAVPKLTPRLPWIMAGHVTIEADDPRHPASASPAVIGRLRQAGFDGIVVTDDATMVAYQTNLRENAVSSLEAGGDLILVTYDEDLVWEVLSALLEARKAGRLSDAVLADSRRRLAREAPVK